MPLEIEVKMALKDAASLRNKLAALGAIAELGGGVVLETNVFFDTPQADLRSTDQGLRLRLAQPLADPTATLVTLTHKGPRVPGRVKSRPETQVTVDDPQAVEQMLGCLGFTRVLSFQKLRRAWRLDACEVVLDHLPRLGGFVEIEGPSEQAVLALRQKLGLQDHPLLSTTYLHLLVDHAQAHGLAADRIHFDPDQLQAWAKHPPD